MELKQLSLSDREAITKVFLDVFTGDPWNDDWSDRTQLDAYITDLAGQDRSLTLGWFDGETLVGLAMGNIRHWYSGTEYYIDEFCIHPARQGQGEGTAFLQAIEEYLKQNGIYQIFLQTEADVPAYGFYTKRGFTEQKGHVSFAKELEQDRGMKQ
ncbi:MAG: GNAT family N-acetyltransferase [Clostridia bacterium]|nr:GNAT family N-acetyltransferase [Clostridia bacterium]